MQAQYGQFFDAFKAIIDQMLDVMFNFHDVIKNFIDGFKKTITTDKDFEY